MKIVFVITSLPTGGAQMMLLRLIERLDARFTPHVISLSTSGDIGPRLAATGASVEALNIRPGVPSPSGLMRLIDRLKTLKPHIVHTWMYHADLMGGLAARLAGVPNVVWAIRHGNLDADKNKYSTLAVVQACAMLSPWVPSKILSNSENARRVHVARGYAEDKFKVIPNGFDVSLFRPDPSARSSVRKELGIAADDLIVGFVGRFHVQKNVEGFFHAAGRLHEKIPQAHFLLAGERLETANPVIKAAIERERMGAVTHLLGVRTDTPRLMAALDVLVSSSTGEAFPTVVGEAMACGVPCVVTDVGDSAYLVGDTGRVVKATDMTGLGQASAGVLSLPAAERRALGDSARKRILENFEIGKIVERYEQLYDELCAE